MNNYMKLEIAAMSVNEGFARSAVAAFALPLNPSLTDLSDIKTAVSEAVTNSIVHAYANGGAENKIVIECIVNGTGSDFGGVLHIKITDYGCGIEDVEKALTPFYTTLADDERFHRCFLFRGHRLKGRLLRPEPRRRRPPPRRLRARASLSSPSDSSRAFPADLRRFRRSRIPACSCPAPRASPTRVPWRSGQRIPSP